MIFKCLRCQFIILLKKKANSLIFNVRAKLNSLDSSPNHIRAGGHDGGYIRNVATKNFQRLIESRIRSVGGGFARY